MSLGGNLISKLYTVPNQDNRNGRYGYQIMVAARSVRVTTINLSTVSEYMCDGSIRYIGLLHMCQRLGWFTLSYMCS